MRNLHKNIPYLTIAIASSISIFYFVFNMLFMQQYLDFDQVAYIHNMKCIGWGELPVYNAHHLHMEIAGSAFSDLVSNLFGNYGFTDIVFNNKIRSLAAACTGLFFLCLYIKDVTGRLLWGICGALLCGFAHGYLSYATKVDTPIYPALGMICILWIFRRLETARTYLPGIAAASGVILFISVIFHQYMAIACISMCITLLLPGFFFRQPIELSPPFSIIKNRLKSPSIEIGFKSRFGALAISCVTALALITAAYFYAGKSVYNLPFEPGESGRARGIFSKTLFGKWVFGYAVLGKWGKGFVSFDPARPMAGYKISFLANGFSGDNIWNYDAASNYSFRDPVGYKKIEYNMLAIFTLVTVCGSVLLLPLLARRYGRSFILALLSLSGLVLFTTYWEGHYYEFWLVPSVIAIVLFIMVANSTGEMISPLLKRFSQIPFYAMILIFVFFTAFHNVRYFSIPFSQKKILAGYPGFFKRAYVESLFPVSVYRYPDNPYKEINVIKK